MPPPTELQTAPAPPRQERLVGPHGEGLAIVAEQIAEFGGVERILATLASRYPAATVTATRFEPDGRLSGDEFHTRLADHAGVWNGELDGAPSPSRVQLVGPPGRRRRHYLFPLYARRLRSAPVGDARAVLSLGGLGWANGVRVPPGARHVTYTGGAPRLLYGYTDEYVSEYPAHVRPLVRAAIPALRAHHRRLFVPPHAVAANSRASAEGLERIVGRPVQVVYPPVRTEFFTPAPRERGHFLVVSRLRAHKRIDVVVEAFRRLGEPLVIAGEGPWRESFERDAPPNVRLVGQLGDEELRDLYRGSRALVSASVEEFGICLVEALAAGVPVIAPREGGSGEIVDDGVNGVALDSVDADAVVRAVRRLEREPVGAAACRASAERFSERRFAAGIERLIEG